MLSYLYLLIHLNALINIFLDLLLYRLYYVLNLNTGVFCINTQIEGAL